MKTPIQHEKDLDHTFASIFPILGCLISLGLFLFTWERLGFWIFPISVIASLFLCGLIEVLMDNKYKKDVEKNGGPLPGTGTAEQNLAAWLSHGKILRDSYGRPIEDPISRRVDLSTDPYRRARSRRLGYLSPEPGEIGMTDHDMDQLILDYERKKKKERDEEWKRSLPHILFLIAFVALVIAAFKYGVVT